MELKGEVKTKMATKKKQIIYKHKHKIYKETMVLSYF